MALVQFKTKDVNGRYAPTVEKQTYVNYFFVELLRLCSISYN